MLIDLTGKVAIVTGGGRGIGRAIADTLTAEGVDVVLADLREDLMGDWEGAKVVADVRDAEDCRRVTSHATDAFGRIDILVNNAGVADGGRVEGLDPEVWQRSLDVNLTGTMLMCQAVIPTMKAQGSGRILNASSFAAVIPSIGGAAYAASKAGVVSLTRVLAGELGPFGITVNAYAPGMIPTEMNRFAALAAEQQERLLDTLSLRRWGEPKDVANLVCFLASDLAGYITGALIDVSGGKLATQMPWAAYRDS